MNSKESELKRLTSLDIVYVVFIIVAAASIYLIELEKKDIINNTNKHEEIDNVIKPILLLALLICYLYFAYDKYKNIKYNTTFNKNLDIGASILMAIAIIILLYLELSDTDAIIDIV